MGLSVKAGSFAAPTSNGQTTTISLGSGFDPKVLLLFASRANAAGSEALDAANAIGFATKNGGAIQQGYVGASDTDNAATAAQAHGINTTRCLAIFAGASATPTEEAHIAAAGDWSDSQIMLTWPVAAAGVGPLVAYLVLGGSDISAARVGEFAMSVAAATQDVTVASGFGQPDLLMFVPTNLTALGNVGSSHFQMGLGVAKSATDRLCSMYHGIQAHTSNVKYAVQKARAIFSWIAPGSTVDAEADLAAKANWPTDGFRLAYTDQAGVAYRVLYVALKGTFTSTLVNGSTPTAAGGSPQDHAHGSVPKAFVSATTGSPPQDTVDSASTSLGGLSFGVSDLTTEAAVASGSDSGQGTSWTWRAASTTKALLTVDQPGTATGVPTLRAQADASASGNNLRLTYTTLDSEAREFIGVVFGAASDTTAPTVTATEPSALRISRQPGKDSTTFSFTADEAYDEYQLRVVPSANSTVSEGTLIESGSGGSGASRQVEVTDDELADTVGAGTHLVKVFVRDLAGNWSSV